MPENNNAILYNTSLGQYFLVNLLDTDPEELKKYLSGITQVNINLF